MSEEKYKYHLTDEEMKKVLDAMNTLASGFTDLQRAMKPIIERGKKNER